MNSPKPSSQQQHADSASPAEQMIGETPHKRRKPPAPKKKTLDVNDFVPYLFGAVVLGGAAYWYFTQGVPNPRGEKMITAELTLQNQCGLVEDAYIITLEPSGPTAKFSNGRATIQASTYSYVVVKADPAYKDSFSIETPRQKVEPKMLIPVICDEGRARSVLRTFNQQFDKNK